MSAYKSVHLSHLQTRKASPVPATPMSVLPPPDAFDYDLMVETLRKLKEGKMVEVPVYDFNTHSRAKYTVSYNDIHRYSKIM